MPYTSAVINEIQRVANIIAPNPVLFHKSTVETEIAVSSVDYPILTFFFKFSALLFIFQGYKVAANTLVNGDIHQMMKTDPLFEEPDRFWPERYIGEDGVTLRKVRNLYCPVHRKLLLNTIPFQELVERTLPFGIGKRRCAGEGKDGIVHWTHGSHSGQTRKFYTNWIISFQNFQILPLSGCTIDLEPVYTNIHFPKPQNFRLEKV